MLPEGVALIYYSDLLGYTIEGQYPEGFKIHPREVNLCTLYLNEINKVLYRATDKKFCIIYILPNRTALFLVLNIPDEMWFYADKFEELVQQIVPPIGIKYAQEFVEGFYEKLIEYRKEKMDIEPKVSYKIVIVGDPQVGKSSLLWKYSDNFFTKLIPLGAQYDFFHYILTDKNIKVRVNIWDFNQLENISIESINPQFFHFFFENSDGIILVYDVSRNTTFDHLEGWNLKFKEIVKNKFVGIVIGNKIDLERVVMFDDGKDFATKNGYLYDETSVIEGFTVYNAFNHFLIKFFYPDKWYRVP